MRGKLVKRLRRAFAEKYGHEPRKSEWTLVAGADGKNTYAVTRNEERIWRDLYRKYVRSRP